MSNKLTVNKPISSIEAIRLRLTAAEVRVTNLREQSRLARRRRKEAKRIAQKARKAFKQAKCDLANLRVALEESKSKVEATPCRSPAKKKPGGGPKTGRKQVLLPRSQSQPKKPVPAKAKTRPAPKRSRTVPKAPASLPPDEASVSGPVFTTDTSTPTPTNDILPPIV